LKRPPDAGSRHLAAIAPITGARIETNITDEVRDKADRSPPSRGRGLKRKYPSSNSIPMKSPPSRGRGLKPPLRSRLVMVENRPHHGGAD